MVAGKAAFVRRGRSRASDGERVSNDTWTVIQCFSQNWWEWTREVGRQRGFRLVVFTISGRSPSSSLPTLPHDKLPL